MTSPAVIEDADVERVAQAFAVAEILGKREDTVAALAGVSRELVDAVIDRHPERVHCALLKFEAGPRATEVLARKAQGELVRRIAEVAAQANPLEAIEYLKPINKIIENADRVRIAEREVDKYANLPVIHVTIGARMATTITAIEMPSVMPHEDEVIDTVTDLDTAPVVSPVRRSSFVDVAYDLTPLPFDEDLSS